MAKKNLKCVVCEALLSKDETEIVDENTFTLLEKWPSGIKVGVHCFACFEAHVRADGDAYNEKVEQAKNVNVFYATQSKESRVGVRVGRPIEDKDCADLDEVVLRLAYKALESKRKT